MIPTLFTRSITRHVPATFYFHRLTPEASSSSDLPRQERTFGSSEEEDIEEEEWERGRRKQKKEDRKKETKHERLSATRC